MSGFDDESDGLGRVGREEQSAECGCYILAVSRGNLKSI
jgi:hypothetical protein